MSGRRRCPSALSVGQGAAEKLNPDEEVIEVWEKDPSVQAFTDLMNRALDKPKEQEFDIGLTGELSLVPAYGQVLSAIETLEAEGLISPRRS